MIDALGFILSLISIPAIVKLDEVNTRYNSRKADIEMAKSFKCGLRPKKPNYLYMQMLIFNRYVIDKISYNRYGNAEYISRIGEDGECHRGYDITYKIDDSGCVTNQKTTAFERMNMGKKYFTDEYPQYRWVTIVEDFEFEKYIDDPEFIAKCERHFTEEGMKKYDD